MLYQIKLERNEDPANPAQIFIQDKESNNKESFKEIWSA